MSEDSGLSKQHFFNSKYLLKVVFAFRSIETSTYRRANIFLLNFGEKKSLGLFFMLFFPLPNLMSSPLFASGGRKQTTKKGKFQNRTFHFSIPFHYEYYLNCLNIIWMEREHVHTKTRIKSGKNKTKIKLFNLCWINHFLWHDVMFYFSIFLGKEKKEIIFCFRSNKMKRCLLSNLASKPKKIHSSACGCHTCGCQEALDGHWSCPRAVP